MPITPRLIYPAAALETAASIWEAVLDMERVEIAGELAPSAKAIRATREAIGAAALRMTAIGWTDAVEAAWKDADTDGGKFPDGGQYGRSFDWEFIPDWIVANIDWSDNSPRIRSASRIPHLFPGTKIEFRSPLDDLDAGLRAWLVDEMGMQVEHGGGGCLYLRHEGPHGSYVLVTCEGGGGMPSPDSWQVGTYRDSDSDSILDFVSDQQAVTLRMAVGAACGALADFVLPPVKRFDVSLTLCVTVEVTAPNAAAAKAEALRVTDLMSPDAALDGWNSVSSAEGRPTIDDVRFDIEGAVDVEAITDTAKEG